VSNLLRAELIKLRTTRTFLALTGIAVGLSLLLTILVASLTEPDRFSVLVDVFASDTSSLFILILAIVGMSGEWRHRTITSSLLAAPERLRFLAAKTIAFGAAGVVLSVAISIAIAIAGYSILELRGLPTPPLEEVLKLDLRNALVAFLLGALGVGIGALLRNQAVAIVTVLIFVLVVEPMLLNVANDYGRFGPLNALPTAIINLNPEDTGLGDVELLAPAPAVLAMIAWIGALFALAGALLKRRDLE
jgi:ABC-type transport system involved in multi-copper enzyme maturation permease subunit